MGHFALTAFIKFRGRRPKMTGSKITVLDWVVRIWSFDPVNTYSGHSCREWSFTWKIKEAGQAMRDTLCIGTSDHLPYHLTKSGGWAEATYEWNPSVSVDAPNDVVP